MTDKFRELFIECSKQGEITGERAIEIESLQGKDTKAAESMLESFRSLTEKLKSGGNPSQAEFGYLWVAAQLARNVISSNINKLQASVKYYDEVLVPRLYAIVNEQNDDKRNLLIEASFSIDGTEKIDLD